MEEITRRFGCGIARSLSATWQLVLQQQYLRQREQYPSDWFLLADQDELQVYPAPIQDVIADCGRWDYIRGCMIDRLARDGGFPPLAREQPVWDQFPMGGALTPQILAGDPRKVVAVRGPVVLLPGNHHATEGKPCPTRDYYIPIHHFKWIAGIEEKLRLRAEEFQRGGFTNWTESARFVEYYRRSGGRIELDDPNLLIGECAPEYPHWEKLKKIALSAPVVL